MAEKGRRIVVEQTIAAGAQWVHGGLRVGNIGAGLVDGAPAARLGVRHGATTQDVLVRVGDAVETELGRLVLVEVSDDGAPSGRSAVTIRLATTP